MSTLIIILALVAGVALATDAFATPGDQLVEATLGGALIGLGGAALLLHLALD